MNPGSTIARETRELIIQLSRGNIVQARMLSGSIQTGLNGILSPDSAADSILRRQAQQTLYAIEEVLTLVGQGDLQEACQAARDAAKEWRVKA